MILFNCILNITKNHKMKTSKSMPYAALTLCVVSILFLSCNPSQSSDLWASLESLPLDPNIEDQIDEILPKLTLEQKVGQVIQGDTGSLTPEDVKKYKPYLNVSEGFLLEKNKNATIVYMSYNDTDIGDICVIPSENVVSLCELKTSKKYVSKTPKTLKV